MGQRSCRRLGGANPYQRGKILEGGHSLRGEPSIGASVKRLRSDHPLVGETSTRSGGGSLTWGGWAGKLWIGLWFGGGDDAALRGGSGPGGDEEGTAHKEQGVR